ncbi:MAG TPA: hypothetical protein VF377_08845 [Acidimicrobiia bacterium]
MSEILELGKTVLAVIGGAGTLAGGVWAVVVKSRVKGSELAAEEWRKVAEAREERIAELEAHVHALEERIVKLEGKYEALADLKAEQIAGRVVERLVEAMEALDWLD